MDSEIGSRRLGGLLLAVGVVGFFFGRAASAARIGCAGLPRFHDVHVVASAVALGAPASAPELGGTPAR